MAFNSKKVYVDGKPMFYNQDSLNIRYGTPLVNSRVQIFGRQSKRTSSRDYTNAFGMISFTVNNDDYPDSRDPRRIFLELKQKVESISVFVESDPDTGRSVNLVASDLVGDLDVAETPDGNITFEFHGTIK
jgi:hypothetical protein